MGGSSGLEVEPAVAARVARGACDAGRSDAAVDAATRDSGAPQDSPAQDRGATQDSGACTPGPGTTAKFSFFLTSMAGIIRLSGSTNGFGGDLRFGKSDGLAGADEICRQLAEAGHPGAGCKTWRAF
jgi:hypothetical protein